MENTIRFAFVSDGDIFHFMTLPYVSELDGVIAGMRSGPIVVEIPQELPEYLGPGWKYIDGQFVNVGVIAPECPDDYEVE
jgi:hypothetical protein